MSQQLLVKRASVVSLVAGVVVALLVDLVYRFPPNLAETGCSFTLCWRLGTARLTVT